MICAMPGCSVEFEPRVGGRPQRFCCPEHSSGGRKRRYWEKNRERILIERKLKLPPKAEKVCAREGCSNVFVPVNRGDQKYCSKRCLERAYRQTPEYKAKAARAQRNRNVRPTRQAYMRTWRRRGMDDATFLALREAQDGRCAICQEPTAILVPDHDHATGKERALLCRECNLGLGHFKDNLVRLESAIRYLNNHKE